jgi:hypothetical protein
VFTHPDEALPRHLQEKHKLSIKKKMEETSIIAAISIVKQNKLVYS